MDVWSRQIMAFFESRDAGGGFLANLESALESKDRSSAISVVRRYYHDRELDESTYQQLISEVLLMPLHATLSIEEVDASFVQRIPISYVRSHRVVALTPRNGYLRVVTDDPEDVSVIDYVGALLGTPVQVELAPLDVVMDTINKAYSGKDSDFSEVLDDVAPADLVAEALKEDGDLLDSGSRAPVVKLVNMILFEAVKRGASDVHIQPFGTRVQARFRIDGVLYDYVEMPPHLLDEVISRIKIIGKMDIAEKRIAQDGRTTVTVGDKSIDLRISIIPTSHGERAVLRLLDKSLRLYELAELGMAATDRGLFQQLIQKTHGIVLVTGPTGSGKSTTLYAALQYLDCKEKNILTLEDPIEYQLPGISQTQVATKKGMTFATGLRAVLRQDPDIIMVGEIRDEETARMAVQSSLTGHLVFSTLHTNNAAGAVARLLDLGIEPYLVASSLLASLAQRLVRVVCPKCSVEVAVTRADIRDYQLDQSLGGSFIKSARGCEHCAMTGYRGRMGVFELICIDEEIRELIVSRAKSSEIEAHAIGQGRTTLRQDAVRKLKEGSTTLEEIARVTQQDATVEEMSMAASAVPDNDEATP